MGPAEAGTHLAPANADNTEVLSLDYELFAPRGVRTPSVLLTTEPPRTWHHAGHTTGPQAIF